MIRDLEGLEGRLEGFEAGPWDNKPQKIKSHLSVNQKYAEEDELTRGIHHSKKFGDEVKDGYLDRGGERKLAFK